MYAAPTPTPETNNRAAPNNHAAQPHHDAHNAAQPPHAANHNTAAQSPHDARARMRQRALDATNDGQLILTALTSIATAQTPDVKPTHILQATKQLIQLFALLGIDQIPPAIPQAIAAATASNAAADNAPTADAPDANPDDATSAAAATANAAATDDAPDANPDDATSAAPNADAAPDATAPETDDADAATNSDAPDATPNAIAPATTAAPNAAPAPAPTPAPNTPAAVIAAHNLTAAAPPRATTIPPNTDDPDLIAQFNQLAQTHAIKRANSAIQAIDALTDFLTGEDLDNPGHPYKPHTRLAAAKHLTRIAYTALPLPKYIAAPKPKQPKPPAPPKRAPYDYAQEYPDPPKTRSPKRQTNPNAAANDNANSNTSNNPNDDALNRVQNAINAHETPKETLSYFRRKYINKEPIPTPQKYIDQNIAHYNRKYGNPAAQLYDQAVADNLLNDPDWTIPDCAFAKALTQLYTEKPNSPSLRQSIIRAAQTLADQARNHARDHRQYAQCNFFTRFHTHLGEAWFPQILDAPEENETARQWWRQPLDAHQNPYPSKDRQADENLIRQAIADRIDAADALRTAARECPDCPHPPFTHRGDAYKSVKENLEAQGLTYDDYAPQARAAALRYALTRQAINRRIAANLPPLPDNNPYPPYNLEAAIANPTNENPNNAPETDNQPENTPNAARNDADANAHDIAAPRANDNPENQPADNPSANANPDAPAETNNPTDACGNRETHSQPNDNPAPDEPLP